MEPSKTWKDVVYQLFVNEKLNFMRCLAIMNNQDVGAPEIVAAVIEGAVGRGETENVAALSTSITEFIKEMETYNREQVEEETRVSSIVEKFRSQITMFLPMDQKWAAILTDETKTVKEEVEPKYIPYLDAIVKERFIRKPGKSPKIEFTLDQKCRVCKKFYYGFSGYPGLAVCADCVETYTEAVGAHSREERLKYEADMRDFMEFLTSDKFEPNPAKRKRDE